MIDPENSGCDWRPAADFNTLRARARLYSHIRQFFADRGVLEVDTPVLSATPNCDPHIESFSIRRDAGPSADHWYLQTSPEFHMKRLLAAGSGSIYQISRVFRQGEAGRNHNPEFTLLEWYRPGYDHQVLMDEVEALLSGLLQSAGAVLAPSLRVSYRELFIHHLGIDPCIASKAELLNCALGEDIHLHDSTSLDHDAVLDLLLSHSIQPQLGSRHLCFVYDYPASQAALARIRHDGTPVAERFEVFYRGMELGNGYHELADAEEQRRRFISGNTRRERRGLPALPWDERLLAALESGLPDCAGVAVGVDRILMLMTEAGDIREVLAFPVDRA